MYLQQHQVVLLLLIITLGFLFGKIKIFKSVLDLNKKNLKITNYLQFFCFKDDAFLDILNY